jgi:2'-5' RNA ligase
MDAPPALLEFQKALAEELGFKPGRFHAHFTLGRIKSGRADQNFFQALEKTDVKPVPFTIDSIELVQSELLPEGTRHTVLSSACFG